VKKTALLAPGPVPVSPVLILAIAEPHRACGCLPDTDAVHAALEVMGGNAR